MTTTTLTGQQRAVAVLAAILAVPGLADATWKVYPPSLCNDMPELSGQLPGTQAADDIRAAIDTYALAFELSFDDEKHVAATDYCATFTEISTSGVIDGVRIKIWGAGR